MGVPAEVLAEARAELADRNARAIFGVWPEHWHAFTLLCDTSTQWRAIAGMTRLTWLGLDYAALTPTMLRATRKTVPRRHRRPLPELMRQLRVMERAVLAVRNEE